MSAYLLTGADWYQRRYTTEPTQPRGAGHWDGGDYSFVEVPYLIGQKVRLTGDKWLNPGAIEEVLRYWHSSAHHKWYPVVSGGYLVMGDWTVEAVEDEIERRMA